MGTRLSISWRSRGWCSGQRPVKTVPAEAIQNHLRLGYGSYDLWQMAFDGEG